MLLICVRCVNDVEAEAEAGVACGSTCCCRCCCHFMVIKIGFALNAINKTPEHFRWQMSSLKIMQRIERPERISVPRDLARYGDGLRFPDLPHCGTRPETERDSGWDWRQVARSVRKFAAQFGISFGISLELSLIWCSLMSCTYLLLPDVVVVNVVGG